MPIEFESKTRKSGNSTYLIIYAPVADRHKILPGEHYKVRLERVKDAA